MDHPTKDGHRTGKKRSTKELETVQTTRKKVVPESRKIRPRQRRGFFIFNFPECPIFQIGKADYRVFWYRLLTVPLPHQP
jgi:hypothetical protein